jgi:hypothetical protein
MKPKRIQLRRTKGWRKPEEAIIVSRPSRYGNPHRVGFCPVCGVEHSRGEAVAEFRAMLDESLELRRKIQEDLRGKDLACWCKLSDACHADVLLSIANNEVSEP